MTPSASEPPSNVPKSAASNAAGPYRDASRSLPTETPPCGAGLLTRTPMDSSERLLRIAQDRAHLSTPAFVIDEQQLATNVSIAASAIRGERTRLLFAMKSFSERAALGFIAKRVAGLHASSLFESTLARELLGERGVVHLTTPGIKAEELDELCRLCDYISFNSLSQWTRHRAHAAGRVSCGLRVNPKLSLVADRRYDPCRSSSKLGVPIDQLTATLETSPELLTGIEGVLVHTNCDATDFWPLLRTVQRLEEQLTPLLERLNWINLGGGYLFDEAQDFQALEDVIAHLQSRYRAEVFFEPGAAISRSAGFIVTEVVDVFASDDAHIAVLDTSINHMPEVFEYQWCPEIPSASGTGNYRYRLAGATCLAGDLFGEFAFESPLQVGSRIVIGEAGAYSLVKASMFNGVNLPNLYRLTDTGALVLDRTFTYSDFLSRCGASPC